MSEKHAEHAVDEHLISLLRCPLTRSALRHEGEWLIADVGGLAYPIRNGIPVMLPEEARLPQGCGSLEDFKKTLASAALQGATDASHK